MVASVIEDRTVKHPDGRTLGFSEFGAPAGKAVFLFHGTPGSRVIGRICESWGQDLNCRVIALDRPGYGLSSFQEGRKLSDHAGDVAAVASELGIDRFAVTGVSGGAPYVLACAEKMPERVTAGAVISGFLGIDPPVDRFELAEPVRLQFEQHREDPETSRPNFDAVMQMLSQLTDRQAFMTSQMQGSPPWIRELVEKDPSIADNYAEHILEGLRPGSDGGVQEIGLYSRPWGIDLSAIKAEIGFWHGGKDPVPRSHVEATAAAIPKSKVHWQEDCGHVDCFFFMPEILKWFAQIA